MLKLGLTGGIATGKSTVAKLMEAAGAYVVDADQVAHRQMLKGQAAYQFILNHFGTDILEHSGEIDRRLLGAKVFQNPDELQKLNAFVHPHVMKYFEDEASRLLALETRLQKSFLFVMMIPLLFEAKLTTVVDKIMVVSCRAEQQLARLMERNGWNIEEAQQRINAQWPIEDKIKQADWVINNSLSPKETEKQVKEWLGKQRWDTYVNS